MAESKIYMEFGGLKKNKNKEASPEMEISISTDLAQISPFPIVPQLPDVFDFLDFLTALICTPVRTFSLIH